MKALLLNHEKLKTEEMVKTIVEVYTFYIAIYKLSLEHKKICETGSSTAKMYIDAIIFSLSHYEENGILPGKIVLQKYLQYQESDSDNLAVLLQLNENDILHHAMEVKLKLKKRELSILLEKINKELPYPDKCKKLIELSHTLSMDIDQHAMPKNLSEVDYAVINDSNGVMESGIITSISKLNRVIGVIRKGTLLTVAAPPSMFKSTFALNFIYVNAIKNNKKVLMLGLETPLYNFLNRYYF